MLEGAPIHTGFKKSTHPRTSSSTELLDDVTLPYLCNCPGAKWAHPSSPSWSSHNYKSILMNGKRKRRKMLYDSLATQIPKVCYVHSTHLWIQRTQDGSGPHGGKDKYLGLRCKCSHAPYMQDIVLPALVPQISCMKQLLLVLHASERPMALSCCVLRAWGCSNWACKTVCTSSHNCHSQSRKQHSVCPMGWKKFQEVEFFQ